jgi:hypothetical protein
LRRAVLSRRGSRASRHADGLHPNACVNHREKAAVLENPTMFAMSQIGLRLSSNLVAISVRTSVKTEEKDSPVSLK